MPVSWELWFTECPVLQSFLHRNLTTEWQQSPPQTGRTGWSGCYLEFSLVSHFFILLCWEGEGIYGHINETQLWERLTEERGQENWPWSSHLIWILFQQNWEIKSIGSQVELSYLQSPSMCCWNCWLKNHKRTGDMQPFSNSIITEKTPLGPPLA